MVKIWLVVLLLLFSVLFVYAEEIPCVTGDCAGWYVSYNKVNDYLIFKYKNNTGETAFHITCRINFYDAGGNHLGNYVYRHDGPIHTQLGFKVRYPNNLSRMDAEIYYKKEY